MRIIDLTHPLHDGLSHFITPPLRIFEYHQRAWNYPHFKQPSTGFDTRLITMIDHMGTHVDAPSHIHEGAADIGKLPLSKFIGQGLYIDVSSRPKGDPITSGHILAAISRSGIHLASDRILLIRGWDGEWLAEGFYECRGLTTDAVEMLESKGIQAIGTDLATLDDSIEASPSRPAHVRFLASETPIFENLANLSELPSEGFDFFGAPLRIHGLTASPVRAFALL